MTPEEIGQLIELVACDLDKEYYDKSINRINTHINKLQLW